MIINNGDCGGTSRALVGIGRVAGWEGHHQPEWRRDIIVECSLVLLEITNLFIPAPAGVQFMIVISDKSSVRAQTETT